MVDVIPNPISDKDAHSTALFLSCDDFAPNVFKTGYTNRVRMFDLIEAHDVVSTKKVLDMLGFQF